ncbi:anthranilate phosphoribosyltransferase [Evansella vedderi]|uniref:Anthranilate phosphoribosyltransferase n=1 Tax=Evansella vedderi TaxID=38282 RepID=A0ABT9ZZQ2_9BACI|nr:anthranilate phosphoribosyltransferase [Evansella vedderi]MDQ0256196.1 anthranilate phosphoribosyltransferase [Evansella vedderi]
MKQWIKEVAKGKKRARDLSYDEATLACKSIIAGEATDVQVASFLIAERLKTESPDEVAAFVHSFRGSARKITLSKKVSNKLIDFSGPYDGRKTFAATIPVSILLAESGIPVYLHGSDTLPPKYGSSLKEIIEQLQIPVDLTAEQVARSIEDNNIGFAWTEYLCPPLALLRSIREEMEVRTFINIVEKLLNLADSYAIMLGIFHKTVLDTNVANLRRLNFQKAYIVQGAEGSEDLPIHRKSFMYEVTPDEVRPFDLDPAQYRLHYRKDPAKEIINIQEQTYIISAILHGESFPELDYYRNQVIFNTAVRYFLYSNVPSIEDGVALTLEQLRRGKGADHLEKWRTSIKGLKNSSSSKLAESAY